MTNENLMKKAIKLALKGTGKVSPNPRVGALIVKDNMIIAEGYHQTFGGNHAEIEAINNAKGTDLEGATMVVNLEPCSHEGKTPPCVDAIIEKKFAKILIGSKDPNPLVSGLGKEKLIENGIEVIDGIIEEECNWINRSFFKFIQTGRPYITIKVGQSLNGSIATAKGESKWITSEESRRRSHALRAENDAVLIGKRTASVDSPELTVRDVPGRNPKRIILDTNLSLPLGINTFKDTLRNNTYVICKPSVSKSRKADTLTVAGLNIIPVDTDNGGKIDLNKALEILGKKFSIASILIEGGAAIFSSFIQAGLADELHLFIAPMIIGGGINAFNGINLLSLKDAPKFITKAVSKSGDDLHYIAIAQK
jgi:diaminohydroxyphosphoribosylaminopyrimidine deaminase/5-amino-6-(5-phosphoribosylamino)uracil reductase